VIFSISCITSTDLIPPQLKKIASASLSSISNANFFQYSGVTLPNSIPVVRFNP
jgi:hypothetical protein